MRVFTAALMPALLAALLGVSATGSAQEGHSVEIHVRGPEPFDAADLSLHLARDLGVDVLVEPGVDESDALPLARVIVERVEGGALRVFVQRPSGHTLVRVVAGDTPPEALALLVSNLVRDESAELLDLLRVEPVPPPEPAPEVVPQSAGPEEPEPLLLREPEPDASLGVDFVPGLGVSSVTLGRDHRAVSLGVLGAWSGALTGVSLSSLVDIVERRSAGAQLAGLVSVAGGPLDGVQLSGLLSASGSDANGAQLSGLLSVSAGDLDGAQLSGLLSVSAGDVRGLQMSGLVNVAGQRLDGAQVGLTNIAGSAASGGQLGLVNVAGGDVDGAQIGLVNIAGGHVRGLQLGLVNVSERADAPIGLASIQRGGETELRLGIDTGGFLSATLVHGSGVLRTLAAAVVEPFLNRVLGGPGLGLGLRAEPDPAVTLDFEALGYALFGDRIEQLGVDVLADLRAVVTFELIEHVALHVSLGARLNYTQAPEPELGAPFLETDFGRGDPSVRLWPTLGAGVSFY